MTHTLVLAGEPLRGGAEGTAVSVLSAFDVSAVDGRILSVGRALELDLEGVGDRIPVITAALREALPEVDLAVMPSENRRKKLLCADMDSTIVVGETIDELADAAGLKQEVAAITARAMQGELDFEQALDARVAMLKGLEAARLDLVAQSLTYSPGAKELVATMKRHGAVCILVSGGFDRVTGAVRKALGFDRDIANHLIIGGNERLTGIVQKPVVDAEMKRDVLERYAGKAGLSMDDCITIGDGANDCLMVERAGMGVAYHAKPALRSVTGYHIAYTGLRTALYFQGYSDALINGKL